MNRNMIIILVMIFLVFLPIFPQTNMPDSNTVALYNFNEGQGDTLFDYSGNNNHGILVNNPTWVDSTMFGAGLYFDGVDDYVEVPHHESLNPNDHSWTVEVVFKTNIDLLINQSPSFTACLITKNQGDFSNGYNINFNWQNRKILILLDDFTNTNNFWASTSFVDSLLFHHIALVYDKNFDVAKLYLDGILEDSVLTNLQSINPTNPLYIGKYIQGPHPIQYFQGIVDEVVISNIARIPEDFIVGVSESNDYFPERFKLQQNYPNPFNPSTTINFSVPELSFVTLKVYDVLGKEIVALVDEEKAAGSYEVNFSATKLSSGIYFYKLQAGNPSTSSGQGFVETKKMILLR